MGEYVVVTTAESDESGRPKMGGAINGGFYQKTEDPVSNHPSVVISVDDINETVQKIKNGGGNVLGEVMQIHGIGSYVSFLDTEDNRIGVLQPLM